MRNPYPKSHRVRGLKAANKLKSVFCGDVYVAKNTLRGEGVFLCAAHKNALFGAMIQ